MVLTNTPDVLTSATADLTMALLLAAARRLGEAEALARSGAWHGWGPRQLIGLDLDGARLGVVGLGRIGRAVAHRARAFGMRILYAQPSRAPADIEQALAAEHRTLEALLGEADAVVLTCPLVPWTHHLIGTRELALMKPGAVLVNTARGPIIDEVALIAALKRGHLLGVGLDVFEREPEIPEALRGDPRAFVVPHIGSAAERARAKMAETAAPSIVDVLAGRRPAHLVNPDAF